MPACCHLSVQNWVEWRMRRRVLWTTTSPAGRRYPPAGDRISRPDDPLTALAGPLRRLKVVVVHCVYYCARIARPATAGTRAVRRLCERLAM